MTARLTPSGGGITTWSSSSGGQRPGSAVASGVTVARSARWPQAGQPSISARVSSARVAHKSRGTPVTMSTGSQPGLAQVGQ